MSVGAKEALFLTRSDTNDTSKRHASWTDGTMRRRSLISKSLRGGGARPGGKWVVVGEKLGREGSGGHR